MNALLNWLTAPEWVLLVKTLLHSLWQGALAALLLAIVLRRLTNPHWRYRAALTALAIIPLAGLITWSALASFQRPPPPAYPTPTLAANRNLTPLLKAHPDVTALAVVNRSPAPSASNWTAWLALLWMVGAGVMLVRGAVKVAGAEQLRRASTPLENAAVNQLLAEARRVMRISRQVRVAVTEQLTSPAVVGVLVPTLVLPLSLVSTLTPDQIRFVLLHELAHIRRGDYFANLLQLFAEALLFFNPAVWWLSHQVRREREACCDALAIELSGAPAEYARTLVHVAENALSPAPAAAPAFGNQREPTSLSDRIQRLLVPGYRPSLRLTWRAMLTAFVLGAMMLVLCAEGTRVAVAQINKPQPQTAKNAANEGSTSQSPGKSTRRPSSFETSRWLLDLENRIVPGSDWVAPFSEQVQGEFGYCVADATIQPLLPLPLIRLKRNPHSMGGDGDHIPFLGDVPALGKLFSSEAQSQSESPSLASTAAPSGRQPARNPDSETSVLNGATNLAGVFNWRARESNSAPATSGLFGMRAGRANGPDATPADRISLLQDSSSRRDTASSNATSALAFDTKTLETNVQAGVQEVRYVFNLTNVSTSDVVITGVVVSCGCTTVRLPKMPWRLAPGDSGPLPVTLSLTGRTGLVSKTLTVNSDRGATTLTVKAQMPTNAVAQPERHVQISGLNPHSSITHDLASGKTTATGGSVVQIGDNKLRADTIQLDTRSGHFTASGNVQVESPRAVADASRDKRGQSTDNPQRDGPTNLFVRTYRVDPNTFYQGLESVTSRPLNRTNTQELVRAFFSSLGVDLNPPRSAFFNDGAGEIFVRAPKADLDVIESALQVVNASRPQVNIKVRFVELDAKAANGGLDLFLGNITPNATIGASPGKGHPASVTTSNNPPQDFTGILTDPQYRVVLRALEQRKDANVLAMQEVTTLSGRQAQIQTVELRTVVNGVGLPVQPLPGNSVTNSATNLAYQTQVLPFGPVLDVIPTVSADGYTIQMTVIPSVTEFLGYDDPGKLPNPPKASGKTNATLPLPRVRVRQMSANAQVWDGQTLVLGMANDQLVTKKASGGFVKENLRAPEVKKKQLLVFITPTIIDQAGNRANAEAMVAPTAMPPPQR
jgi:beta-lactamase regulating signal transducer with metallopeptidase domain/type II secretory pathway component GspD/PulD (secretin)